MKVAKFQTKRGLVEGRVTDQCQSGLECVYVHEVLQSC